MVRPGLVYFVQSQVQPWSWGVSLSWVKVAWFIQVQGHDGSPRGPVVFPGDWSGSPRTRVVRRWASGWFAQGSGFRDRVVCRQTGRIKTVHPRVTVTPPRGQGDSPRGQGSGSELFSQGSGWLLHGSGCLVRPRVRGQHCSPRGPRGSPRSQGDSPRGQGSGSEWFL